MYISKNKHVAMSAFLVMILFTLTFEAQTFKVNKSASSVKIEGTSNIHDWEETAEDFNGSLNAELKDGQLVDMEALVFTVVAESIKSGKNAMDKNTYKALQTDEHKKIVYELKKVNSISPATNNQYSVSTHGHLTVAGTRRPIDIVLKANVKDDEIVLKGSSDLKFSDFKIEPPSALFGTIKTGGELKINYEITFSK